MHDNLTLIWILAVGLSVACFFGYIAEKVKLPIILGYLITGFLIGPNSPGYIADQTLSLQLANIGLSLLMFAVGLQFNWNDLFSMRKIAVPGATISSLLTITLGVLLALFLNETIESAFVIGVAICVSSTVVIVRVLTDQSLIETKQGALVLAWTIVEDLISVFALIVLPSIAFISSTEKDLSYGGLITSIFIIIIKVIILAFLVYFFATKLIEKTLKVMSKTNSKELFTLALLAFVFLIAVGSATYFGISLALGAFIAGTVVGKTELSHKAAENALPIKDAFSVLFFLSIGMLFNPMALLDNIPLFLGILTIILIFRPLIAYSIVKLYKYPSYMAMTLALGISQIGEYSFILAEEGNRLSILPENARDILIGAAFFSIALNPLLFKVFHSFIHRKKSSVEG